MKIAKYLNKNKIGGIILIIVIIIAFGFGGFGGGFMSNNQNNIAKIGKINITTQDLINYFEQSGISQQTIKENINNNVIEELLSSMISTKLLDLEIEDFQITLSQNSLLKKIKLNNNFIDENGAFQRIKYEKFLIENNLSAPLFEQRLKKRELQKKLFDFIGAGTVSPGFMVKKLFKNENKKLELDFINLEKFYKKSDQFNNQDLIDFINENDEQLKVDYIDFKYAKINPKNLIGIDEFNQTFFDKIDQIESNIFNGDSFDDIISDFNLKADEVKNYKYSATSEKFAQKIYEARNNDFDIIENNENFIIYKIQNTERRKPNIDDEQIKDEILNLVVKKNKFDFNKNLLEKIREKKFYNNDFLELGKNNIQAITINSIKDNKQFSSKSIQMLYSLPIDSFTLVNDKKNNIYLIKIKSYKDVNLIKESDEYKSYISKENSNNKNGLLKSYDMLLNKKYKVEINQQALNNVKNLFQ